jgi:hypothetical protein
MNRYVTLPYRPFAEPLNWAKEHCPSYITNDVHMDGYNSYDNSKIDYFFNDDKDALMFMLRWGGQ